MTWWCLIFKLNVIIKKYIKIENFYFELYHFFSTFPSLCFFNQINDFYFFKSYRSNLLMSVYVSKRLTCHIYVITSSNKSPYRNHKLHSMDKTEQYHLITGAVSSLLEKTGVMKELLTYARKWKRSWFDVKVSFRQIIMTGMESASHRAHHILSYNTCVRLYWLTVMSHVIPHILWGQNVQLFEGFYIV